MRFSRDYNDDDNDDDNDDHNGHRPNRRDSCGYGNSQWGVNA
jgi:hypothetical protein